MYKCEECGCLFEEDEMDCVYESRGEFWGFPAYEPVYICPCCGSDNFDEWDEDEDD